MRVVEIIWLDHVIDKVAQKHAVSVEEVEEVLFGPNRTFRVEAGREEGEDLYAAYGQTDGGRY